MFIKGKMVDSTWNFEIESISLDNISVNASMELGMVIVQPQYELEPDDDVPCRIRDDYRQKQIDLIEHAFRIRMLESKERHVPIPFILFPEYSIPIGSPDGLNCLKEQLEQAEGDVIFIGGLEGLSRDQVNELTSRFAPVVDAAAPNFDEGKFVNLCVIAIKSTGGELNWHFQAKIMPSQWEQPRNMAHGKRLLYFNAPSGVTFLCQICFDHIATNGQNPFNIALCQKLIEKTKPNVAQLDFVFVLQYNRDQEKYLERPDTGLLLNHQDRLMKNDMLSVVTINKASITQESTEFGRSGFHYRSDRWQVPTSDVGPKGYLLYDKGRTTSAIFRKRTQAVHIAVLIPPSRNAGDPGNPRQPLVNPRSYLIEAECDPSPCSCLPDTSLDENPFVECDCLPCKMRDIVLSKLPENDRRRRWQGSGDSQSRKLKKHYIEIRKELLLLKPGRARDIAMLLLNSYKEKCGNPDLWTDLKCDAVTELLSALCVLAELNQLNLNVPSQWTGQLGDSLPIVIIDGENKRYSWIDIERNYQANFAGLYSGYDARRNPVLIVALRSGGLVDPLIKPISSDINKPENAPNSNNFTKPTQLRFFICQDNLFEGARQESDIAEYLNDQMMRILN